MREISMKRVPIFVLLGIAILSCKFISADERIDKEISTFIESYVDTFNERKSPNAFFHFPNVWLVGNASSPKILDDSSLPIVDYDELLKTGWAHSIINEITVVLASEMRAFATLDFSRISENGDLIVRSTVMYTIAKKNDKWGIVVAAAISPVAMPD